MGVYRKIFSIFEELGYIDKDMKVDMGSKGSYNAISEPNLTSKIRPLLLKHKLLVLPIRATFKGITNQVTSIEYTYRIVDVEEPPSSEDKFIDVDTVGQGKSGADKGCGMASTYGFKYLWLRLLCLVTGEDADNTSDHNHITAEKAEMERKIQRFTNLIAECDRMQREGLFKSIDNYTRIKAAVSTTKGG
jgi:hypothetical protein